MSASVPPDAAARNRSSFGSADQGQRSAQQPKLDPFKRRRIDVQFKLGQGDFGEAGADTITIRGLRVIASIQKYADGQLNTAMVQIGGLKMDLMMKLSTLGTQRLGQIRNNVITILAGNEGEAMAELFQGIILEAYPQMETAPETVFTVQSQASVLAQLKPVEPTSYPAAADAVVMMQNLAKEMGVGFENAGVPPTMIENQYLHGTAMQKVELVAEAAACAWAMEGGKLIILPIYGAREGEAVVVSAATGMVGYPAFHSESKIRVVSLFNPAIHFLGKIKIESDYITMANGVWRVSELSYELESETPHGQWFTVMGVDKVGINA